MTLRKYAATYLRKLKEDLEHLDIDALSKVVEVLIQARDKEQQVFIAGNGGSAATASHFANDLNKLASMGNAKKFKAIALTDNVPLLTAWANDEDYAETFSRQLDNFLNKGDIVIGISCSGNSKNVISAFQLASERDAVTIGFVGFEGGSIEEIANHVIWVADSHYGRIEDTHAVVCHLIANFIPIASRK